MILFLIISFITNANFSVNNTGIYVFNTTQQDTRARIQNNEINKTRNGIFLRNTRGLASYPLSNLRVEDNTINFGAVPNGVSNNLYGIRLEETDNAYINNNIVEKQNNLNPNLNVVPKLRGISLLNSKGNTVTNNEITKLGAGIRVFGACDNSILACNILDENYHGFKFEGPADISDQLPGAIPTGNNWTTLAIFGASDIDINLNDPIDWFYPQNGYNPSWTGAPLSYNNGTGPTDTPSFISCGQFQIQSPIDERENKLGAIIRNEKVFNNHVNEFILNDKIFAHRFLKQNPSYLTLGASDDSVYQNYLNACDISCVGKFNKVQEYIDQFDYLNALSENVSISDSLTWEYNLKRTNEIHLNYLIGDSIPFSDVFELEDIAWQNSLIGGPGVMMARAMLNLDIEDYESGTTRSVFESEEFSETIESSILVYPNPSNGEFTIESDSSFNNTEVIVQDITGKIVYSNAIISDNNQIQLKLSLPAGIYTLQLKNKDEWIKIIKIAIN